MRLAFYIALISAMLTATLPAFAQEGGRSGGYGPIGGEIPSGALPPPRTINPPPPPVVPPPPQQPPPPPLRVIPTPRTVHQPFIQPQSIDLTNDRYNVGQDLTPVPVIVGNVTDGVNLISQTRFPNEKDLRGNSEWILVRGEAGAVFTRPNEYTAKLESGTIIVSVRRPSSLALVQTPLGDVSLQADGDVMLTWTGDVLRIYNISALGNCCKVKIGQEVFNEAKPHIVSLKTGYEMVAASDHKLTRGELRPADGIARRRAQILANGHLAVCEFSVQSVLESSAIIASMIQSAGQKETRILGQMSKMAAVLNVVNSPYGYTTSGNTGLASTGQPH